MVVADDKLHYEADADEYVGEGLVFTHDLYPDWAGSRGESCASVLCRICGKIVGAHQAEFPNYATPIYFLGSKHCKHCGEDLGVVFS